MGFMRKIKANFRLRNQAHKRIDDATSFVSYDMTEISQSEDEEVELLVPTPLLPQPKDDDTLLLQSLRERSLDPLLLEPLYYSSDRSDTNKANNNNDSRFQAAAAVAAAAFPDVVSFDDEHATTTTSATTTMMMMMNEEEDLTQYPDPGDLWCMMQASSEEEEEDADFDLEKKNLLRGLLIDTSSVSMLGTSVPSKAADNDEFLIYSPSDATQPKTVQLATSPKVEKASKQQQQQQQQSPLALMTTTAPPPMAAQQPHNKLAHIFTEELSTLYEQDESSSLASSGILSLMMDDGPIKGHNNNNNKQTNSRHHHSSADSLRQDDEVSPNERSIHNRWNDILEMTMTGQCADHRFAVMDEAEI